MRKRLATLLGAGGAAALMVGLMAPAAIAATWTVTPGGTVTGTAGTTTLKDTSTNTVLTCKSSSTTTTLKKGSGLAGAGIGSITALSFASCTGPLGITFTVTSNKLPWHLNAVSYASGVTHGTITGINATLSGPSCSALVAGTTATTTGTVKATYSNTTHKLTVSPTGGTLHIWNVSGCFNLIHSGDASTFTGAYAISPAQTITSP